LDLRLVNRTRSDAPRSDDAPPFAARALERPRLISTRFGPHASMATRKGKAGRRSSSYHHGDLAAALIDATKELITERGLDGFTLREVARRVGVTHVAVYRHYADRRALLAAVAVHGFRELRRRLESARKRTPTKLEPRLRALLAAYLQFCWAEPALSAVMFGPRLSMHGEFPDLDAAVLESLGMIEETIAELAPPSALRERSARDLGLALWTFVHGFSMLSHDKRAYPSARKAAAAFDDMLTPTLAGMFGLGARSRRRKSAT
jgi:AcrR family transcriptional regulator